MPYGPKDALRFTKKARSPLAQKQWSDVVNEALKRGLPEGAAIREANSAVKKRSKQP